MAAPARQLYGRRNLAYTNCNPAVVSVAQLVEHRSVAPRVVGSNPIAHPNSLVVFEDS